MDRLSRTSLLLLQRNILSFCTALLILLLSPGIAPGAPAAAPRSIMAAIQTLEDGVKAKYQAGLIKVGYAKATFAGLRRGYEVHFYTDEDVIYGKIADDGTLSYFQRPIFSASRKKRWQSVLDVDTTINLDERLVEAESRVRRDGFMPTGLAILTYHYYPFQSVQKTGREKTEIFFAVADHDQARVVRFAGAKLIAHGQGTLIQLPTIRRPTINPPTVKPLLVNRPASAADVVESYINDQGEILLRIEGDFLFDFDSDRPRPEAVPLVRALAEVVKEKTPAQVFVEGHTDAWGTPVYNDDLSKHRAQAIATMLAAAGVSDALLAVKGYGERQPIAKETHADGRDHPEGRQKNRRVEVRFR